MFKSSLFFVLAAAMISCSPATIARIGPPMPMKPANCEIEVLDGEAKPSRPYRDVGMVELENCQDYRTLPCKKWLTEAACELGGEVVYMPDEDNLGAQTGPITFRLLVATYVAGVRGGLDKDSVFDPKLCNPRCGEDEVCLEGTCQPSDCEAAAAALKKAIEEGTEEDAPDRCVE